MNRRGTTYKRFTVSHPSVGVIAQFPAIYEAQQAGERFAETCETPYETEIYDSMSHVGCSKKHRWTEDGWKVVERKEPKNLVEKPKKVWAKATDDRQCLGDDHCFRWRRAGYLTCFRHRKSEEEAKVRRDKITLCAVCGSNQAIIRVIFTNITLKKVLEQNLLCEGCYQNRARVDGSVDKGTPEQDDLFKKLRAKLTELLLLKREQTPLEQEWAKAVLKERPEWARGVLSKFGFAESGR